MMDDADEAEKMIVMDRFGQLLGFFCPMNKEENVSENRRGSASALTENHYDPELYAKGGATAVLLKDAAGQLLRLFSKARKESVELVSRNQILEGDFRDAGMTATAAEGGVVSLVFAEDKNSGNRAYAKFFGSRSTIVMPIS